MITFERARQVALHRLGPSWDADECGEYMVADYGYEDDDAWMLIDGGRRYIVDGDPNCALIGKPCTVIDKQTGKISFPSYLEDAERFDAMTPVGKHPPG